MRPVDMLDPGAGKTEKTYVWAYARACQFSGFDAKPGVAYDLQRRPGREVPDGVPARLGVVEVIARKGGVAQSFKSVRDAVATALRQQTYVAALSKCLQVLTGQAVIVGMDLDAASSPLVQ